MFDLNQTFDFVNEEDKDDGSGNEQPHGRRPKLSREQKEAEKVPHPYFVQPTTLQPRDVVGVIEFENLSEATMFYTTYAPRMGFGIRKLVGDFVFVRQAHIRTNGAENL
ncbi:hypothetical protein COLO4_20950 [Corchorus olitorius]|uniref:Uncharacterized protein n=1 Tax=Corchorus olitorius TaxID=93759 RepID=A0A1R3IW12_9ROSI|nr:hypothetical protein COLO4_20950 [Corchorus olitorius]